MFFPAWDLALPGDVVVLVTRRSVSEVDILLKSRVGPREGRGEVPLTLLYALEMIKVGRRGIPPWHRRRRQPEPYDVGVY